MINFPGIKIPKVIATAESKYNGHIEVIEIGNTKKIKVDGIDQSLNWDAPNTGRLVWGRVLDVLKVNEPKLKNILILGLGGGTVQHLISRDFPGAHMVSVDIDPIIYELGKAHFGLDDIPNHRVIIDDACRVVVEPENYNMVKHTFQVAFVDIYIGSNFPELGKSGNFLSAVKEMVRPGGLVMINRIYTSAHQEEVNNFIEFVEGFLYDVQTFVVAGYSNSDNILIYGRT